MIDFLYECPLCEQLIFDSHAHYDDPKFDGIRDELLDGLPKHGVFGVINCGCDTESSKKALALAESYPYIYAAAGIHPENIGGGTPEEIKALAGHKKCVAIGEIGLDYYWVSDNKEEQKRLFEEQLELANSLSMPVIVHDRDAHADTLELLKKHRPKGVLHSFSGSAEMAAEILKLGMYLGIGGALTFKNARKLPEVVEMLPTDRLLLETDAPYMTPVPFRGKRCDSRHIAYTAERLAGIRGADTQDLLDKTCQNAKDLFGIA